MKMRSLILIFIVFNTLILNVSCQKTYEVQGNTAEFYFIDTQVVKLCHSIERNDANAVRQLINDGVQVDTVGIKSSMTPLLWAIWLQRPEMVRELLIGGADVNKQAEITNQTPVKEAATLMQFDIVLILLENGADPFIENARGSDLSYEVELHYKLRSRESNQFKNLLKTIEVLKGKGMELNLVREKE